jgi:hypothetical protein
MKYLEPKFVVGYGSQLYRENWGKVFNPEPEEKGKKEEKEEVQPPQDP